jgi:hypothetical protein
MFINKKNHDFVGSLTQLIASKRSFFLLYLGALKLNNQYRYALIQL